MTPKERKQFLEKIELVRKELVKIGDIHGSAALFQGIVNMLGLMIHSEKSDVFDNYTVNEYYERILNLCESISKE